ALAQGHHYRRAVANVASHQMHLLPRDALHPRQCPRMAIVEVVEHRDITASLEQFHTGMRTDIASATSTKNHTHLLQSEMNIEYPGDTTRLRNDREMFVSLIWLVSFNQTNETHQTNQITFFLLGLRLL